MSQWYSLIQWDPKERDLDVADLVDYLILLTGLISLGCWLTLRPSRYLAEDSSKKTH